MVSLKLDPLHLSPFFLQPLFTMSAQQQSIQPFTPQNYEQLTNKFERQPVSPSRTVRQGGGSPHSSGISPPPIKIEGHPAMVGLA